MRPELLILMVYAGAFFFMEEENKETRAEVRDNEKKEKTSRKEPEENGCKVKRDECGRDK